MNKFKNNTKIKIIALLSSMFLWMYVMAVVDPEESKWIENIPVRITNLSDLLEEELMIYPEVEMKADMYITGNLSKVHNITTDDVKVFGEIKNPIEGNNEIYITASTSKDIDYEFRDSIKVISLEKILRENKNVNIEIIGDTKSSVDTAEVESDKIIVSGPRTLVTQVDKIKGVLDIKGRSQDFTAQVELKPVDKNGDVVENVSIEKSVIDVKITMLKEKSVPIVIDIEKDIEDEDIDEKLSYETKDKEVTIKGKAKEIDLIQSISTEKINVSDLKIGNDVDIKLIIPDGISSDKIETKLKVNNPLETKKFTFDKKELSIKNTNEEFTMNNLDIPNNIDVRIEYSDDIEFKKSDIDLYIDLSKINNDNKVSISYTSKNNLSNIKITPSEIIIKS